jgi:hypothetical protein
MISLWRKAGIEPKERAAPFTNSCGSIVKPPNIKCSFPLRCYCEESMMGHLVILTVMFAYKQLFLFTTRQSFLLGTFLSQYLMRSINKEIWCVHYFLKVYCFALSVGWVIYIAALGLPCGMMEKSDEDDGKG